MTGLDTAVSGLTHLALRISSLLSSFLWSLFRLDTAVTGLTSLALRAQIRNDDSVDQLHHFVTVTLLAFFAAVTGFVEYASEPINCWNYGEYGWKHFQDHVNSYCWSHNLYRYPNTSDRSVMPYELNDKGAAADPNVHMASEEHITFYRWVTITFIVQAFLFKIPNLIWSEFNAYSGSNVVKMVKMLQSVLFSNAEEKKEKLDQVALFLEQWLRIHRSPHWFLKSDVSPLVKKTMSCMTVCVGNNMSNFLSSHYLITKFLFLLNNLFQFLLLSLFLDLNFWNFGRQLLEVYAEDPSEASASTSYFPTVVLCHFQTYDKLNATGQWVQCILRISIILEKLFLIEWFWLLLLLVITVINFIVWCFRVLQTRKALQFIQKYMKLMGVYSELKPVPKRCCPEQFVMEYLRNDGIFIIRILALNTNEVIVAELVEKLWERYCVFEVTPRPASLEMTGINGPRATVEPSDTVEDVL